MKIITVFGILLFLGIGSDACSKCSKGRSCNPRPLSKFANGRSDDEFNNAEERHLGEPDGFDLDAAIEDMDTERRDLAKEFSSVLDECLRNSKSAAQDRDCHEKIEEMKRESQRNPRFGP